MNRIQTTPEVIDLLNQQARYQELWDLKQSKKK